MPTTRRIRLLIFLSSCGLAALVVALLAVDRSDESSPPSLEPAELGSTRPVHKFGDIFLAGQPAEEDLQELKELGFETVINLRQSDETDWDEAAVASELDLQYVHLPFRSEEQLTDELFDEALLQLRQRKPGKTLLHCGSCNRVGAIWYAYRVLEEDAEPKQAEQEARTAGMRSEWLLAAAKAYVERRLGELDR